MCAARTWYPLDVRLAHFSDLHLLSPEGVRMLQLINKRWIGALNLLANRGRHHQPPIFEAMIEDLNAQKVDHIVCTGDITNLALESEFAFGRSLFERFELSAGDISVIPGNHDAYVHQGIELFRQYFGEYHRSDDAWVWGEEDAWPLVRVRGDVAIIGLTTSFQTPWFTAYGRIGDTQRQRLSAVLADERLAGKFRILAIHHPVIGRRAENRIRGLKDWPQLGEIVREHGVELILHGHEHRDLTTHVDGPNGPVAARCIQSGSYEANVPERRARYRIFEIRQVLDIPQIVGEDVRVWEPQSKTFVHERSIEVAAASAAATASVAARPAARG